MADKGIIMVAPMVRALLREIEGALAKFEDGSYGKCTECGGNIGIPRLTRLPYTRMCIECKEKEEAGTL